MGSPIRRLLEQVQHNELVMPAFQREYVWNLDQAKQLLSSLFRQYPTGSVLFWETSDPPELKNGALTLRPGERTTVILDGQQRLTTLYLLIRGAIPPYYSEDEITHDPRHLYMNLETGEFKYYLEREMASNPLWRRVPDLFSNAPDPLTVAIERVGNDNLKEAVELQRVVNGNLNRLLAILKQEYPVQLVPDTANIDDAIRIFDLVNRQGTKLTEAELALAHMSGHWPDARRVLKQKLSQLAATGFVFDLTFIVRCMTATVTQRAEYELIHNRPKDELLAGWEILDQVLDYIVSILRNHAFIHSSYDLASPNVLVPIVTYLSQNGGQFANAELRNRFLRWMYAALLWGRYSGQVDQRLDRDIGIVLRSPNPTLDLENEIFDQRGRIEVRTGDMEGRDIRNAIYRMAFIVAKSRGAVDWFTGAPLSEVDVSKRGQHFYIFPGAHLYEYYDSGNHLHRQRVNEIANRALLSSWPVIETDPEAPLAYLETVEQRYPGSLHAYLIPHERSLWSLDRYEEFLRQRRRLIASAINGFLESFLPTGKVDEEDLVAVVQAGETERVEFKETLRMNLFRNQIEPQSVCNKFMS